MYVINDQRHLEDMWAWAWYKSADMYKTRLNRYTEAWVIAFTDPKEEVRFLLEWSNSVERIAYID